MVDVKHEARDENESESLSRLSPDQGAGSPAAFVSPFLVPTPPGAEGWDQMYPCYARLRGEQRELEERRFWVRDSMHFPEPAYPFDVVCVDSAYLGLGQTNTRVFCVPPALGLDYRIINGYVYISANSETDPEALDRRAQLFASRAGYYYENWAELYARWEKKVMGVIRDLERLEVPDLPDIEDEAVILEARGVATTDALLRAYSHCLHSIHTIWQYHFELLNLGYAAFLAFHQLCKQAFPDISDPSLTQMVSGIELLMFRPDDELKKLARAARELGVADAFEGRPTSAEVDARLASSAAGRRWRALLEESKRPWFNMSNGIGICHRDRSWIDDPSFPLTTIGGYIERLSRGEDIERPTEAIRRERDRVTAGYRDLLANDENRRAFDDTLGLARTVFPYVEDHSFYVEHWFHTVFWNKIREFGALMARKRLFAEPDDIFYLHRYEVYDALYDLMLAWAAGSEPRGRLYWGPIIEERKAILLALRSSSPAPALGTPPTAVSDPLTLMLWGVTDEQIARWLSHGSRSSAERDLHGFAGSPGVAEGPARVVMSPSELGSLQEGEIMVCPTTAPSWTPIFGRLKGAVSDIGGIMCHAAVVSREYGMPAVVGTGYGTTVIKTGQRLRIDGDRGIVTILE